MEGIQGAFFYVDVIYLNKEGSKSKAYADSALDQHSLCSGGQHTLAFNTKCVMPKGRWLQLLVLL